MAIGALAAAVLSWGATAAPFAEWLEGRSPSGRSVRIWGEGDEYSATFEADDGHAVLWDNSALCYYYARKDPVTGVLVRTAIPVGDESADDKITLAAIPLHQRDTSQQAAEERARRIAKADEELGLSRRWEELKAQTRAIRAAAENGETLRSPPSRQTLGNVVGLTLLIDFPIMNSVGVVTNTLANACHPSITKGQLEELLNGESCTLFGNASSVRKYYEDVSCGNMSYTNIVLGWFMALHPREYYDDPKQDCGPSARELIGEVLDQIRADPEYTTKYLPILRRVSYLNSSFRALNVWFAGPSAQVWSMGLWAHKSSLGSSIYNKLPVDVDGQTRHFYSYQITPITASPSIGTFCHENGHMVCGFPDLYDYDHGNGGPVGRYSLMSNSGGNNPGYVDAYLRAAAGWVVPKELPSSPSLLEVTNSRSDVWKYTNPLDSDQYYLIENRQKTGRDANLPGGGILIWRCDEMGSNTHLTSQSGFSGSASNRVNAELSLEQADGLYELERRTNTSDANDLWFSGNSAAGYGGVFSASSSPCAKWRDASDAGVWLSNFSVKGETMTFFSNADVVPYLTIEGCYPDVFCTASSNAISSYRSSVGCDSAWTVSVDDSSFVTLQTTSGTGDGYFYFSVDRNYGYDRSCVFTVTRTKGGLVARKHFTQYGPLGQRRPVNDDFANATRIYGATGSTTGSNVDATYETGEPLKNYKSAATNTIWWVWTAPSSGSATFSTTNTTFDTVMGIYTGTSVSSLTAIAQDDDGGASNTSVCTFDAVSGKTYYIAVSGYGASKQGTIKLGWSLASSSITYSVAYVLNSGTAGSSAPTSATYDMAFKVSAPSRSGYVFAGWTVTSGLNTSTAKYGTTSSSQTTSITSTSQKCLNGATGDVWFKNLRSTAGSVTLTANWTSGVSIAAALDNTSLTFTTGGSSPWIAQTEITHDGVDAVRSGAIGHSQTNWLQTVVSGPGTFSFWWYVSCETGVSTNWDYLAVFIDNVEMARIAGTNNVWSQKSYSIQSGTHTIKWMYRKDASRGWGEDAGFVDQVTWTPLQAYTVTYMPGSYASGLTYTAAKTNGVALALRNATYSRTGYTQAAWSTNSNGTSSDYELGANYTADAVLTLYPYWTANAYTVSYSLDGGTHGAMHPSFATYDTAFCVSAPTKSGYVFAGWTVTSGLDASTAKWGTTYSPSISLSGTNTKCVNGATGNVYFNNLRSTTGGVTLTANWTSIVTIETALDSTSLSFKTGGSSSWIGQTTITHDGIDAARSGALGNSQTNWLQTTVSGPGTISFWWYASSEQNYDFLEFLIDGSVMGSMSGTNNVWTSKSFAISTSGAHTLEWRYRKDGSVNKGEDAGFVDQVTWAPLQAYTVTFDANGGTIPNYVTPRTVTVVFGRNDHYATTPPTRAGYTFNGYYTTPSGGAQVYTADGICIAGGTYWDSNNRWKYAGNLTLYAHWTVNHFTLVLNKNDGTGTTFDVEVPYGANVSTNLPGGAATLKWAPRRGFKFMGWAESEKSKDVYLADMATVPGTLLAKGETKTLYAIWQLDTQNAYAIQYIRNDGSGSVRTIGFVGGVATNLNSVAALGFARRGYDFGGWAKTTEDARNKKAWMPDMGIVRQPVANGKLLQIYAIWTLKEGFYSIRFNKNDGSGKWRELGYEYGKKTRLPTCGNGLGWTREGYVFAGWALGAANAAAGVKWKDDWAYVSTPTTAGKTISIYALWRPVAKSLAAATESVARAVSQPVRVPAQTADTPVALNVPSYPVEDDAGVCGTLAVEAGGCGALTFVDGLTYTVEPLGNGVWWCAELSLGVRLDATACTATLFE